MAILGCVSRRTSPFHLSDQELSCEEAHHATGKPAGSSPVYATIRPRHPFLSINYPFVTARSAKASAKGKRLFHERRLVFPSVPSLLTTAAVLVIIFVITLLLQRASGAYSGSFGAESDEASHYVTSIMVRDYLAQGLPGNPVTFAKNFYVHYPRVGFGLWPPLFHVGPGLWMLAFGVGRTSIMSLLAILTTIWAIVFYQLARPLLGTIGAVISAALLVMLPITQKMTSTVMPDMALAVIVLLAMAAYARYLENERTADAFSFGFWAAVALLVKYNALALALLPPLCVVITGRYYLLRRKNFWLPIAVVLVIAGPWYFIMRHFIFYAAEPGSVGATIGTAIGSNVRALVFIAGPIIFLLAVIGFAIQRTRVVRAQHQFQRKEWSVCTVAVGMILCIFLFHSLIYPIYDPRYLLPAIPPLLMLASLSVIYMYSVLSKRSNLAIAACLLVVMAHLASNFAVPKKKTSAYVKVMDAVAAAGLPRHGGVLVSADGVGEGMLTAEFAMRDLRPDHYIVRASKVLATQTLMGDQYQLKYKTPDQVMTLFDSIPIAVAVIQKCSPGKCGEHENILVEAATLYPDRWRLSSIIPDENGSPIRIYQIIGNESKAVRSLQIDMTNTLGTTVEK
jgi:hypothetical protein